MHKIALLAAFIALSAIPGAAQAQSLGNVLRAVTGIGYQSSNGCIYQNGINQVMCQANRASNVLNSVERMQQQRNYERQQQMYRARQEINDAARVAQALEQACKAGDRDSCGRATLSTNESKILSALVNACTAGDERSCTRLRGRR